VLKNSGKRSRCRFRRKLKKIGLNKINDLQEPDAQNRRSNVEISRERSFSTLSVDCGHWSNRATLPTWTVATAKGPTTLFGVFEPLVQSH
jgi:hypothetical protein